MNAPMLDAKTHRRRAWLVAGALMLASSSCEADRSAREHDLAAESNEKLAQAHQALLDGGVGASDDCGEAGETAEGGPSSICWTSVVNPTPRHREAAEEHRIAAEHHRARAQELRDAEKSACSNLPPAERDIGPFFHREDIESVRPLLQLAAGSKAPRALGAAAVFRPVPGLDASRMRRLVDCHVARNAALGFDVPQMNYCPLVLPHVTTEVSGTPGGIVVTVTSSDPAVAEEIAQRMTATQNSDGDGSAGAFD